MRYQLTTTLFFNCQLGPSAKKKNQEWELSTFPISPTISILHLKMNACRQHPQYSTIRKTMPITHKSTTIFRSLAIFSPLREGFYFYLSLYPFSLLSLLPRPSANQKGQPTRHIHLLSQSQTLTTHIPPKTKIKPFKNRKEPTSLLPKKNKKKGGAGRSPWYLKRQLPMTDTASIRSKETQKSTRFLWI